MASHMRSKHSGEAVQVVISTLLTLNSWKIYFCQVQQRLDAAKVTTEVNEDKKDETVRGSLPLFKLRSKSDREAWRKLVSLVLSVKYDEHFCAQAFPLSGTINVGAETRKYQIDSAIMATVILDLQPFNQVNRYKSYMCGKIVWTYYSKGRVPNADFDLGSIFHPQLWLLLQGSPWQWIALLYISVFSIYYWIWRE